MSSSLQLVVEQPLRFSTDAFRASDLGTAQSAVLLGEISLIDAGMTAQPATLMAVATDHAEGAGSERAERALESFRTAVIDGTQTDMAARLKSAFRTANADVYGTDPGEISMVALVARGKYASFATVGDNQAFLYRADRINQVTRNQRNERSSGRRSEQRTLEAQAVSQFLGFQERLESRLPTIFDMTLLPLDAVALVSGVMADSLSASSTTSALAAPGQTFSGLIERQVSALSDHSGAATVLEVLPVREPMPEPPAEMLTTPTYLPYVLIALVVLTSLILAIWYFFL